MMFRDITCLEKIYLVYINKGIYKKMTHQPREKEGEKLEKKRRESTKRKREKSNGLLQRKREGYKRQREGS